MRFPLTYFQSAPPFEIWHSHPEQKSRVLITAGVDGDEYCGIEAARQLIKSYRGMIPITIIPIVNIEGYRHKVSYNPLDDHYPKYIYPGNRYGSSSSRLMHAISRIAKESALWIDLHGGATDEHLQPFVWSALSGNLQIDELTRILLSHHRGKTLYENSPHLMPTTEAARHNTAYIVIEAGQLGIIDSRNVDYHLHSVKAFLNNLTRSPAPRWSPTYREIVWHKDMSRIPPDYLWYSTNIVVTGR